MEIRQKISNNPLKKDIERDVIIDSITINLKEQQIVIYSRVENFSKENGEKVYLFEKIILDWVIDNSYQVKMRDAKNKVVVDENAEPVLINAFDFFGGAIIKALAPMLKAGILNDDQDDNVKRFDK